MRSIQTWLIIHSALLTCLGCTNSTPPRTPAKIQRANPEWVVDEAVPEVAVESGPVSEISSPNETVVSVLYRPDDTRRFPDEDRLKELGILKYESKRLVLYTDIDPDLAATLPPVIDGAYDSLVDYFGELSPARSGDDFQMTGYLIQDKSRFQSAGLIPEDLNYFDHGQHRGQEFWMYEQEFDYYRRHLLIHEATHCFMMILPGIRPPLWYLEGMAELFATHRLAPNGPMEFGVMPEASSEFVGFGRIEMIQNEVEAGRLLNIDQASALGSTEFANSRSVPYAWSWALCNFLDSHPRYQARFRELGNHLVGSQFSKLADALFTKDKLLLAAEWEEFVKRAEYGWDFAANAFVINQAPALTLQSTADFAVIAARGWQTSGYRIEAGKFYRASATGEVTLANFPKPWISEPQGVSIRYANGLPIGRLLAGLLVEPSPNEERLETVFLIQNCGPEAEISFERSGLLMFQINDFGSERHDNTGSYQVQIHPQAE